jgi:hypothetical protein
LYASNALFNLTAQLILTGKTQLAFYFCKIMSYLLGGILLYLLYRFIAGFVWPVYKATSQVKKQFETMRQQMHEEDLSAGPHGNTNLSAEEKPKFDPGGEYIPFEEIKEK